MKISIAKNVTTKRGIILMTKIEAPQDFYELLQIRVEELQKVREQFDPESHDWGFITTRIHEVQYLQSNLSSYFYRIRHKKQCD